MEAHILEEVEQKLIPYTVTPPERRAADLGGGQEMMVPLSPIYHIRRVLRDVINVIEDLFGRTSARRSADAFIMLPLNDSCLKVFDRFINKFPLFFGAQLEPQCRPLFGYEGVPLVTSPHRSERAIPFDHVFLDSLSIFCKEDEESRRRSGRLHALGRDHRSNAVIIFDVFVFILEINIMALVVFIISSFPFFIVSFIIKHFRKFFDSPSFLFLIFRELWPPRAFLRNLRQFQFEVPLWTQ